MTRPTDLDPDGFANRLTADGARRAWLVCDPETDEVRASGSDLRPVAEFLGARSSAYRGHEAVFLEVGPETGALFGVFIHRTLRGQAQGGVRHWPYSTLAAFLDDGLRLAEGMGRKCALAGLWWGGGKAIIARQAGDRWRDAGYRRVLYGEFGGFVSSLRGCYVTAEDVGTTPVDMVEIFRHTRFATCVPSDVGGSGNPSSMTAAGVVQAMEAALDWRGLGTLEAKRVAMQGAGNVGSSMIGRLLDAGVAGIMATELSASRRASLLDHFAGRPVTIELVEPGDDAILAEPCDILAPNALGGALGPKTIPSIQAQVICGAANNPLQDDERDAALLEARGITFVPDYIANRMGIVACANEQAGTLPDDPAVLRHLDRRDPDSIYAVTRDILERARVGGVSSVEAANRRADERSAELHPLWGHRAGAIIGSLVRSGWERG